MKTFIGNSVSETIQYNATSGGIGTSLIQYLFDSHQINTAITLCFNKITLKYEPKIIYSFDDYEISGSVYHEIELINYIKNHLNEIKGVFCCFALPCQIKPIKQYLNRNGISTFLFSLTCSSQQNYTATKYLLHTQGISSKEINSIQYRGNGWPGGINISLKNGNKCYVPNVNSIWAKIFHSRLFILRKCFRCKITICQDSDITLGDPWLKEFIDTEKKGKTIFRLNTPFSESVFQKASLKGYITANEVDSQLYEQSQKLTILRKKSYHENRAFVDKMSTLFQNKIYKSIVLSNLFFFNVHCKIKTRIEQYLLKKLHDNQ